MLTRWGNRAPSLWSEMSRLSREMDRLFGETSVMSRANVFPPLNLYDEGESLVIRSEIPGVNPKELDINATSNSLTIKGERKMAKVDESASFHRKERGYGTFSRTLNLPQEINPNKVHASYKLGVLEILLPKAEMAKQRKITVSS